MNIAVAISTFNSTAVGGAIGIDWIAIAIMKEQRP